MIIPFIHGVWKQKNVNKKIKDLSFSDIKNIAMVHTDGSVTHDGHSATWNWGSDLRKHIDGLLKAGRGFVIVPCAIESLENNATVADQTEGM